MVDKVNNDLFLQGTSDPIPIVQDMWLLPGLANERTLLRDIERVCAHSPLRHMMTSRGQIMSVAMTNCGKVGWVSDRNGYRYQSTDPVLGGPWLPMPETFRKLASRAAVMVGYNDYNPDACLVNCYQPGTQMGAHQDRDERDFSQPIVSVSLGLPARFFVVGPTRKGKSTPVDLTSGDVLVWGGASRLYFHGVRRLKAGKHPLFGSVRYNLTFRRAL